jgi:hypothetical protein
MTEKLKLPLQQFMEYIFDADLKPIAHLENNQPLDRAEFIVKACNNYNELVKALKEIKQFVTDNEFIGSAEQQIIGATCFMALQKAKEAE